MEELELKNPQRDKIKEVIKEFYDVSKNQDSDIVGKAYSDLLRGLAGRLKFKLLQSSPFVLCFVYHPEGEILLKGFRNDVLPYLKKRYPVHIRNTVTYDNRFHWDWKNNVIKRGRGGWRGSKGIEIFKPRSSPTSWSPRKGESKKTLRKWRVDVGNETFFFKRMPSKWIPAFSIALLKKDG